MILSEIKRFSYSRFIYISKYSIWKPKFFELPDLENGYYWKLNNLEPVQLVLRPQGIDISKKDNPHIALRCDEAYWALILVCCGPGIFQYVQYLITAPRALLCFKVIHTAKELEVSFFPPHEWVEISISLRATREAVIVALKDVAVFGLLRSVRDGMETAGLGCSCWWWCRWQLCRVRETISQGVRTKVAKSM